MKKVGIVVLATVAALLLIAVFVIANGLYSVSVNEFAAVREFGKVIDVVEETGLHWKTPFIQSVQKISSKITMYDVPASDVITRDKKTMISDNYILWRVTDPVKYIQTLNAVQGRAEERIEAAVYNSLKKIISSMDQDNILASRGERLNDVITEDANTDISVYGIEILTSKIKALDLPNDNKKAVYTRMISERENIAASYKAEGAASAQKIRNTTDREVAIILAEAEANAAKVIGEGEAEYMRILQEAYSTKEKAEFYQYVRSLEALKAVFSGTSEKTVLLDKDSEIAAILYGNINEVE